MTLAQIDALATVESRAQNAETGALPPGDRRTWGTAHDFANWERRVNG